MLPSYSNDSTGTRTTLLFAAILIAAALLRFVGLTSGIPYAVGVDEPQVLNRAVIMMKTGDFNPHFFDYPALYIYVQLAVAIVRFMAGAAQGYWHSLDQVTAADFFLWGRTATALIGIATVLIVYRIGLRWGPRPALLAAALMAVMPAHVRESHFVLTDVPTTFFTALTCLLALRAHEQERAQAFAWAGFTAGLAAATKYPSAVAILLPLAAVWMTPGIKPSRLAGAIAAVLAATAAFLLGAPYTLLDLPGFLEGFARLAAWYVPAEGEPGWSVYLKHLRNNVHWTAFLLMLCGTALALVRAVRGPARAKWVLVVVFPIVYFCLISQQHGTIYGRYLLPIVPFTCILAAAAASWMAGLLRRWSVPRPMRTGLVAALTAATLVPAAVKSIEFDRTLSKRSTAALAYDWLVANVPRDAPVAIECASLVLTEAPLRSQTVRQLRMHDHQYYVQRGFEYLVAASPCYGPYLANPQQYPTEHAQYVHLFARNEEVARFAESPQHPGPEFRIFKVRR